MKTCMDCCNYCPDNPNVEFCSQERRLAVREFCQSQPPDADMRHCPGFREDR